MIGWLAPEMTAVVNRLVEFSQFWWCIILIPCMCMTPNVLYKVMQRW
jgi:hypothetical protein